MEDNSNDANRTDRPITYRSVNRYSASRCRLPALLSTLHSVVAEYAEGKAKVKVTWIYIAPSRETSKALRHGQHSFTCKLHHTCL